MTFFFQEYAIKKRMGIKDAQQTLLEEVKMAGKLTGGTFCLLNLSTTITF